MNHLVLSGMTPARAREHLGEGVGLSKGGRVGRSALPASVNELGPAATEFALRNARLAAEAYASTTKNALQKALEASSGGNVGAALAYARKNEGHPYVFGTIWDCSGLVGTLQNIAEGKGVGGRRYSTPAFHGDKAEGFTRGKQSNFKIGVNPSPGKSGHMVAELNGHRVEEAGGVGLRVDGAARSVNDPMFSWRGGLAYGGRVRGRDGDMPMDLVSERGRHYSPILADLAAALATGRGYAGGTLAARAGFNWTGEKAAELVVNPQLRHYSGGEQVLRVGKGKGKDAPPAGVQIDQVTFNTQDARGGLQQLHFAVRSLQQGRH